MSDEHRLTIRFSVAELEGIRVRAEAAGLPPSSYVRMLAQRALDDQRRDEALQEFEERQRLFLAEILRRLIEFRLLTHDTDSPEAALVHATRAAVCFAEKLADGQLTLAALAHAKES